MFAYWKINASGTPYAGVYPNDDRLARLPWHRNEHWHMDCHWNGKTFYNPTGTLNFSYGDVFVSFSNAESNRHAAVDGVRNHYRRHHDLTNGSARVFTIAAYLVPTEQALPAPRLLRVPDDQLLVNSVEDVCQQENYYYDSTYISSYSPLHSGRLTGVPVLRRL